MDNIIEKNKQAEVLALKLAHAWLTKGKFVLASRYFSQVLELNPTCCAAYIGMGRVALAAGDKADALEYLEKAVALAPDNPIAHAFHGAAQDTWTTLEQTSPSSHQLPQLPVSNSSTLVPKIALRYGTIINYHRSGWKYALETLYPLHRPKGILFDDFLEHRFVVESKVQRRTAQQLSQMKQQGIYEYFATAEDRGIIPYREPWIGIVHNPPNMPQDIDFYARNSVQQMFANPSLVESLAHCVGLFALSEYTARWLRQATGKPVSALLHPTELPETQFDMDRFKQNPKKKIVQIGWWLRRLDAIFALPLAGGNPLNYQKVCLMPGGNEQLLKSLLKLERDSNRRATDLSFIDNTTEIRYLPNEAYDRLLSENLVFVDLYDSSANNVIIECIARATPILVNPLPPVVEYLGEAYPFYFESYAEAADKALDVDLVERAHNYLKECPTRIKLDAQYFLESFANSAVYQSL